MPPLAARRNPEDVVFSGGLAADARDVAGHCAELEAALAAPGPESARSADARRRADEIKGRARALKERFFHHHAAAIYDEVTDAGAQRLRVSQLLYAAAERYPGLLPTRDRIDRERALMQQSAKQGHEVDQGLFIAHVLADERCGVHLIYSMLQPKAEALALLPEFQRSGRLDLGEAQVERKGKIGHVTLSNPAFLNAEGDDTAAALETAVDLVLLEFDGPRAGGFAPLRFLGKGKSAVLGLVCSKTPEMETVEALCARLKEATRYVVLDRLAISPQCGFASTVSGNPLSREHERRKLALVVEAARRVWGTA
jgi:methionine synthase II (cobalamin-independent)